MSSLKGDKNQLNEKAFLQSKETRSLYLQNLQPPPQQQQQDKEHSKEKEVSNRLPDNTKDTSGKTIDKVRTEIWPAINTVNNYYGQIFETTRDISFDYMDLQKEIIKSFQSTWIPFMNMNLYHFKRYQEKMIEYYPDICNVYIKNLNLFKTKRTKNEENPIRELI
jgi:hypothetical protein